MHFRIKLFKAEQILESHIVIDAFLKAISEFDNNDFINLNKDNVVDFCLLKNKYVLKKYLIKNISS